MCTVYEFPMLKLPQELEERLVKHAEDYVELLNDTLGYFADKDITEEELNKFMEMIIVTYTEGICKAVDELEF